MRLAGFSAGCPGASYNDIIIPFMFFTVNELCYILSKFLLKLRRHRTVFSIPLGRKEMLIVEERKRAKTHSLCMNKLFKFSVHFDAAEDGSCIRHYLRSLRSCNPKPFTDEIGRDNLHCLEIRLKPLAIKMSKLIGVLDY